MGGFGDRLRERCPSVLMSSLECPREGNDIEKHNIWLAWLEPTVFFLLGSAFCA
jgi:hypothetical protein